MDRGQRTWLSPCLVRARNPRSRPERGTRLPSFIVGLSVPFSALLVVMLRSAYPLQPGLTALIAGLAAAAAAATLLNLFHPFDAAATDLVVHAIAVALVLLAVRAFSSRLLSPEFLRGDVTGAMHRSN